MPPFKFFSFDGKSDEKHQRQQQIRVGVCGEFILINKAKEKRRKGKFVKSHAHKKNDEREKGSAGVEKQFSFFSFSCFALFFLFYIGSIFFA